jgi:hypothetical protein
MDEPSEGTLRFSEHWILTNVFVTQADILASTLSTLTQINASPKSRTLPYRLENQLHPTASAEYLVPAIVGARTLTTLSFYAFFQGIAASKLRIVQIFQFVSDYTFIFLFIFIVLNF